MYNKVADIRDNKSKSSLSDETPGASPAMTDIINTVTRVETKISFAQFVIVNK
jgi:hypothetical protein